MPIRIYALAKQLKLDSKLLVDICAKAGVTGKGSALANLTDEETQVVKDFLSGKRVAPAAAAPSATAPMVRPSAPAAGSSVPELPTRPAPTPGKTAPSGPPPLLPSKPAAAAAPVAPEPFAPEPVVPEVPEVAPVEEAPLAASAEAAPAAVEPPSAPAAPPREEFRRPVAPLSGKVPMLSGRAPGEKPPLSRRKPGDGGSERSGPTIKLAPLPPSSQQPVSTPKAAEPAPQKPDIKLPLDAIRAAASAGMSGPLASRLAAASKAAGKKAPGEAGKPAAETPEEILARAAELKRKALAKKGGRDTEAEDEEARNRAKKGGPKGAVVAGTEEAAPLGGREFRQLKRKRTTKPGGRPGEEEESSVSARRPSRIRRTGTTNTAAPRKTHVIVQLPCSVRDFSEAIGVPARNVLGKLLTMGVANININAEISAEIAELLAVELGVEVDFRQQANLEDQVITGLEREDQPEELQPRPPVVTFLGHVDHGKTSLLDRIIGINVVSTERGGITQHIRAYRVERNGRAIAFVDTPGHEAFTEMRARGANVTDIAVLVVAADDGVMPQTEEAISHAKAAGVPIVVALNKIDLPGVNMDRIFQQLATNDLLPSQWGGDVEVVSTSAITGKGIDDLLETLLTVAELHEYKANPDRPASGTCLETELHEGRGVVAKVLVQNGTLRVGDTILCGPAYGRVKAMYDTLDAEKRYEAAGPSTPVHVTGLNVTPGAGDRFYALDDISQARQLAEERSAHSRQQELSGGRTHVTLENLFEQLGHDQNVKTLNIILRADTRGSIEAIRKELGKLEHPEVQVKILQATVGGITEADVHLADASDAVIIGFNVVPDETARGLAEDRGVQIRRYDIIYNLTDDLRAALEGMLKPERRTVDMGRALVLRTFKISRVGTVAGCRVMAGTIPRDARMRVIRESRVIGEYNLDSLKREKDDVREVREGMECGLKLVGFDDVKEGDVLESYRVEEVARTF